jgi:glutathione peroxidase-family protein
VLVQELGELYSKYQKKGLVILGFPCNQFNNQEPGDNKEIKKFAKSKGADFPMMSKIEVNGANGEIKIINMCMFDKAVETETGVLLAADPLYGYLKSQKGGILTSDVKWNFTKFLIGKDGNVVKRCASSCCQLLPHVLIWLHEINFDFFARYGSVTNPNSIEGDIQELLAA